VWVACAALMLLGAVWVQAHTETEAGTGADETKGAAAPAAPSATPGYREPIAEQLRYMSQASYCSVDSVSSWTCPVCKQGSLQNFKLTHKFFDTNTNTFGFAGLAPAAGENVIVFAFRGATPSGGRSWITHLNSERMAYPGLRGATVHKEFYHSYQTIARQINLAARSLLADCRHCRVYVTGHSMGAAIATLAAADLYAITPDLSLYTFGSPRVGDEKFAAHIDRIIPDTYRIVNSQDLVPHLPQRFLGFRHVSREIWYHGGAPGSYRTCLGGEDDSCSNSVNLHIDENSIQDHATYLGHPMGCRRADLHRMGLISMIEQSIDITPAQPSSPMHKLRSAASTSTEGSAPLATDEELLAFEEKGINLLELRSGTGALEAALPPLPDSIKHLEVEMNLDEPVSHVAAPTSSFSPAVDAALLEVEAESAVEAPPKPHAEEEALEDVLELEADRKEAEMELSGGVKVYPARVLDPLKRPDLNQLHASFYKVQQDWTKLPVSWNPQLKEETDEERWNRMYPEPK